MNSVLQRATEEAKGLPDPAQEELGRLIIEYIDRWQALRSDLDQAAQQIAQGEVHSLEEVVARIKQRRSA